MNEELKFLLKFKKKQKTNSGGVSGRRGVGLGGSGWIQKKIRGSVRGVRVVENEEFKFL